MECLERDMRLRYLPPHQGQLRLVVVFRGVLLPLHREEEEDEETKVVLWLSEGFWLCVEGRGVEIIMVEGWDSMVSIREVEDSIVEVDDKEVMGKGLMKIGDGLWDFKFNLEDWPTPKGWNREGIMMEICKGLRWVWGKITREWSVEEIIGWERYWEGREDM